VFLVAAMEALAHAAPRPLMGKFRERHAVTVRSYADPTTILSHQDTWGQLEATETEPEGMIRI